MTNGGGIHGKAKKTPAKKAKAQPASKAKGPKSLLTKKVAQRG